MMKKSSTKIAPKGRMPTRAMLGRGFRYVIDGGICRGIWLTRTGDGIGTCLKPAHDPANDSGRLIMNQMPRMTSIVVKGTAPLEPFSQRRRFKRKKTTKTRPGIKVGVSAMFFFQASPLKFLYTRAET